LKTIERFLALQVQFYILRQAFFIEKRTAAATALKPYFSPTIVFSIDSGV